MTYNSNDVIAQAATLAITFLFLCEATLPSFSLFLVVGVVVVVVVVRPVFFNLFAAAEPYTSVKVTHGTPCIDP